MLITISLYWTAVKPSYRYIDDFQQHNVFKFRGSVTRQNIYQKHANKFELKKEMENAIHK